MGLKIRHNGVITHITGSDYEPGNLGTKRLKIRAGGQVREYGLTTDPNATSYCGLQFMISSSKHYIGKRLTSGTTYTTTRQGNATRVSDYVEQEPRYTYTYRTETYARVTPAKTVYTLRSDGDGYVTGIYHVYSSTVSLSHYYGSTASRTFRLGGWNYFMSSTNGVISSITTEVYGAWASVSMTSAATKNSNQNAYTRSVGASSISTVVTGRFTGNNKTYSTAKKFTWSQYGNWSSTYITSRRTVNYGGTMNQNAGTYQAGFVIPPGEFTSAATRASVSGRTASNVNVTGVTNGNQLYSVSAGARVATTYYNVVASQYSSEYQYTTLNSSNWVSSSYYTYWSTRQSNYTYQSNYTEGATYTTHNFV